MCHVCFSTESILGRDPGEDGEKNVKSFFLCGGSGGLGNIAPLHKKITSEAKKAFNFHFDFFDFFRGGASS